MSSSTNDNFKVNAPKPIDSRYGKFVAGQQQPFSSVSDANSRVLSAVRYKGLTLLVLDGNGQPTEYWYKNGITDLDLVQKVPPPLTYNTNPIDALT